MSERGIPLDGRPPSARALLYLGYARLLGFPDDGLEAGLADGSLATEVATWHVAAGLPGAPSVLSAPGDDRLGTHYIATFEVGVPEPPVPLYESAYLGADAGSRRRLLEELVRFYEFFDLDLGEAPSEAPDHLTVELEFMAALAQLEHLAGGRGADPAPFRRAQRDFLARHLLAFLRHVGERPLSSGLYRQAIDALSAAVEADLGRWPRTGAALA